MAEQKLLIVVDMQGDFIDGALGTEEAKKILPKVAERIREARKAGETVAFTRDTHTEQYLQTREGKNLPILHCLRGERGWEIAEGLADAGDRIFDKPTFGSVELGAYAASKNFTHIELIGVCTDICVLSNALLLKAFCPETKIAVRESCCAGVTKERHACAIEAMKACQIEIL